MTRGLRTAPSAADARGSRTGTGRHRLLAVVAVLALLAGAGSIAFGPAPTASAQAALDTVSITKTAQNVFRAQVTLASSQTGRWEYRFIARNTATGEIYAQSITLAPEYGRSYTFTMQDLPSGLYDLSIEERIWGNDASMVVRATSQQTMGFLAPTGVSAVAAGSGSLRVSWTPPVPAPSPGGYRVQWRPSGSVGAWSRADIQGSEVGQTLITGLTDGVDYDVRVSTVGGSDVATGTEYLSSAAVTARPVAAPDAPTTVSAIAGDASAVWTLAVPSSAARPSDPGALVFAYSVRGSNTWIPTAPSRSGTVWTFSGLPNGSSVDLRAHAVNAAGSSADVTVTVRPLALPVMPVFGRVTRVEGGFELAASFPGGTANPVDSVEWQIATIVGGASTSWVSVNPGRAESGRWSFAPLSAGGDYRVRARSVNAVGAGPWAESTTIRAIRAPSTPTVVSATRGDGSVSLVVDFASQDARPSLGSDARWQVSADDGDTWTTVSATAAGDAWVVSGLQNGADYRFRVGAVNDVGQSGWSAQSGSATPVAAPSSPTLGEPALDDARVALEVSQTSSASAPLQGLEWQLASESDEAAGVWTDLTPSLVDGTATISDLAVGTRYTVRVRAVNDVGASAWTYSTAFTALGIPLQPEVASVRALPGSIEVEAAFPEAPGRSSEPADARWQIRDMSAGGPWHDVTVTEAAAGRYVLDGLTDGHDYLVRIIAVNARGISFSTTASPVRPVSAPAAPVLGSVTGRDAQIAVAASIASPAGAPASTIVWQVAEVRFAAAPVGQTGSAVPPSAGRLAASVAPAHGWVQSLGAWTTVSASLVGDRYLLSGLTNGSTYQVRAIAENGSGRAISTPSANTTPVSAPAAPVFRTIGTGRGSILAAFEGTSTVSAPVLALGWQIAPVSSGQVGEWRSVGSQDIGSLLVTENGATSTVANAYRVGGLVEGQSYLIRVRTANATGVSAWTQWTGALTASAAPAGGGGVIVEDPVQEPTIGAAPTTKTGSTIGTVTGTGGKGGSRGASGSATAAVPAATTAAGSARSIAVTSIVAGTIGAPTAVGSSVDAATLDVAQAPTIEPAPVAQPQEMMAGGAGILGVLGMLGAAIRWYLRRRARNRTEPPIVPVAA
ncbi:fibronectin type III domain-containing protein [Amnibacterium flavum]|uniref:Fibronectin type-III domain-containing protein n=1 Tax=Amnibacterium flavum TaxID=2173173 RepID=A0A2V1HS43_9MICO|nr:fibronectin type III domain-containing protein [Amnibacterium flavum]PVZ95425.1 hypothetical protein DDQ50_02630 [Amnibacterium flavum]